MSKHIFRPFPVVLALVLAAAAAAFGRGADWPMGAAVSAEDLSFMSARIALDQMERGVRISDDPEVSVMRARAMFGELAFDVTSWLTLSAGVGSVEVKPDEYEPYGNSGPLWMAGAKATLWDYLLREPGFLSSKLRIELGLEYLDNQAEVETSDVEWTEWRGSAIFSIEMFAENWGVDRYMIPYSLVLYGGWVYSGIDGEISLSAEDAAWFGRSSLDFDDDQSSGAIAGAQLFVARNFSVGAEARVLDETSYTFSAALHF